MKKSTKNKIVLSAVSAFILWNLVYPCVFMIKIAISYQNNPGDFISTIITFYHKEMILYTIFIIAAAIMLIVLNLVIWLYNKIFKD